MVTIGIFWQWGIFFICQKCLFYAVPESKGQPHYQEEQNLINESTNKNAKGTQV